MVFIEILGCQRIIQFCGLTYSCIELHVAYNALTTV